MQCPLCRSRLNPLNAWRSSSGQLYCSEFCAEIESMGEHLAISNDARSRPSARASSERDPALTLSQS